MKTMYNIETEQAQEMINSNARENYNYVIVDDILYTRQAVIDGDCDGYTICQCCGDIVNEDYTNSTVDGITCSDCINNYYTWCEWDSDFYECDSCEWVECVNSFVSCDTLRYSDDFYRCYYCEEWHTTENLYTLRFDDGDEAHVCEGCGDRHYYWDDENGRYTESEPRFIRNYHDTPDLKFYDIDNVKSRGANGVKYLGVELELQGGGEDDDNAREILNNEPLYAMHDCSLSYGFEVISHPATIDYHLHKIDWDGVIERALDYGYDEFYNGGLHVHVSRSFFKDEENIGQLIKFYSCHYEELIEFAQRDEEKAAQWADYVEWDADYTPLDWYQAADDKGSRYQAVNITNDDTIEFRLFNSTGDSNHLKSVLQFVDITTDIANDGMNIGFFEIRKRAGQKGYTELLSEMDRLQW